MKYMRVALIGLLILSGVFAGVSYKYYTKENQEQASVKYTYHAQKRSANDPKKVNRHEQLTDDKPYATRTEQFFKRAVGQATETKQQLTQVSAKDETYGDSSAYAAIRSVSGMASALQLMKYQMTFNKMSDGTVVGTGTIVLAATAASDDQHGKNNTVSTTYTTLVTLSKQQGDWQVDSLKLGTVTPGDDANETVY